MPAVRQPLAAELLALGLLSASLLAFQVWLTRMIAIQHWYHLAPLIIGLALLGFGIAGVWVAISTRSPGFDQGRWLWLSALATALSLVCSVVIASLVPLNMLALPWQSGQVFRLLLYGLCFVPVFLFGAIFIAIFFVNWPHYSGRIYAVDLLAGAMGALLVLPAIRVLGLVQAHWLIPLLPLLAAACLSHSRRRWAGNLLVAGLMVIGFSQVRVDPAEYKAVAQRLLERDSRMLVQRDSLSQRLQVVDAPGMHDAPGLSLGSGFRAPPQWQLFFNGDSPVPLLLSAPAQPAFYRDLLGYAAFVLRSETPQRVLLLESDSLWYAWLAQAAGSGSVLLTATDAALPELLRELREPRGEGIYPAELALQTVSPRRFLAATVANFDLLVLSVSAPEAGMAATQENYLLTTEGQSAAFDRLDEGGVLLVDLQLHSMPRELLRLVATAVQVLQARGLPAGQHIAVLRDWRNAVLMVTKRPISPQQATRLRDWAGDKRFDLAALPGLTSADSNRFHHLGEPYYQPLQSLLRGEAPESARFDWRPASDNRPFFYSFSRWNAWSDWRSEGPMFWRMHMDWGYLLAVVALINGLLLAGLLLMLPIVAGGRVPGISRPPRWAVTYFAAIGLGFMLVEIGVLLQVPLLLDATAVSLSVVLAAMLVGAGSGSYLQQVWRPPDAVTGRLLLLVAVMLPGLLPVTRTLLPLAADWSLAGRLLIVALPAGLLALPMGFALPHAMARLASADPGCRAWVWALNGFASVIGAVAAGLIAVHAGLWVLMLIAAGCYLLAATALRWSR